LPFPYRSPNTNSASALRRHHAEQCNFSLKDIRGDSTDLPHGHELGAEELRRPRAAGALVHPPRGLLAADVAVARDPAAGAHEEGSVLGGLHATLEAADVLHLAEMRAKVRGEGTERSPKRVQRSVRK